MRTTLDIEKPVLEDLKRLQRLEKKPLSQIASTLLAQALKERKAAESPRSELAWITVGMGAKVDLSDKESLYKAMDGA